MRRRLLLATPALLAAAPSPTPRLAAAWGGFRQRFLAADGRVVDTGNRHISHSEGQGWAMLAAARAGDEDGFRRLWDWTQRHLRRPGDSLLAWRFRPDQTPPVDDPNNATDGDLFIAWALLEGAARWNEPLWAQQAKAIARDVLRLLVRPAGAFLVLLPGARGFEHAGFTVVNPSYYAFPAIRALALAVPDPAWLRVAADGIALLRAARFGRWRLPPDWMAVSRADGTLSPAPGWPARFSYDAVRVPLYLAWAGLRGEPGLHRAAAFWRDPSHRHLPAWTEFPSDGISPYPASGGIAAVAALAGREAGQGPLLAPAGRAGSDYYSEALQLLSLMAERDAATA